MAPASWYRSSLTEARRKLPIFQCKREILESVQTDKTVIFLGETANGKTTQIPQYLLEGGFATKGCIAVTQPRRVAAITIAKRVAEEVGTELGGKVGYSVRFENVTSSATKIKYLTDGVLLREAISDPLLSDYSVVILDEAHERTLNSDILFGIIKLAQKLREDAKQLLLKVIVTSATLDYKQFAEYFDNAPVYFIAGREFSITIMNANKEQDDYVHAALVTVFQIHQKEEKGDILVFCTGQEEIDSMVTQTQLTSPHLPPGSLKIIPCRLYAALPTDQQTEVFKRAPPGCRKVIFSTNISETSVTIPDIRYVVDTGKVKTKSYNPACALDVLSVQWVSKAQADQRCGRAGREFNGVCYRLYTTEQQKKFEEYAVPEILRCCLSSTFLQMIAIGIKNIHKFDFIDKPSDENIHAAVKQLKLLDAVVEQDGNLELTECGKKMVMFPLDPRFSKMIINSQKYRCTDEILTIISLLSVDTIFYTASSQRDHFNNVRQKFESNEGDHIMLLKVYKAYKKAKGNQEWCRDNFINSQNMRKVVSIRKQLSQICETVGIKPCSCHETLKIRICLASGLFMNAATVDETKGKQGTLTYKMIEGNKEVLVHPGSCLFKAQPYCCVYTELVQTTKIYMRKITRIDEESLRKVAPAYFKDKHLPRFEFLTVRNS